MATPITRALESIADIAGPERAIPSMVGRWLLAERSYSSRKFARTAASMASTDYIPGMIPQQLGSYITRPATYLEGGITDRAHQALLKIMGAIQGFGEEVMLGTIRGSDPIGKMHAAFRKGISNPLEGSNPISMQADLMSQGARLDEHLVAGRMAEAEEALMGLAESAGGHYGVLAPDLAWPTPGLSSSEDIKPWGLTVARQSTARRGTGYPSIPGYAPRVRTGPTPAPSVLERVAGLRSRAAALRGEGSLYHGTPVRWTGDALRPIEAGKASENLFGPGLYMTSNPAIAEGFATAKGTRYGLSWKGTPNLLDLDAPLPESALETMVPFLPSTASRSQIPNDLGEFVTGPAAPPTVGRYARDIGQDVYSQLQEATTGEQQLELAHSLRAQGYHGFRRTGGTGQAVQHEVNIAFDPVGDLEVTGQSPMAGRGRVIRSNVARSMETRAARLEAGIRPGHVWGPRQQALPGMGGADYELGAAVPRQGRKVSPLDTKRRLRKKANRRMIASRAQEERTPWTDDWRTMEADEVSVIPEYEGYLNPTTVALFSPEDWTMIKREPLPRDAPSTYAPSRVWRDLGHIEEIPLHSLQTSQDASSKRRIAELVAHPSRGSSPRVPGELPLVIRHHKQDILQEGNHRMSAAITTEDTGPAQGQMFMPARVIDYQQTTPEMRVEIGEATSRRIARRVAAERGGHGSKIYPKSSARQQHDAQEELMGYIDDPTRLNPLMARGYGRS